MCSAVEVGKTASSFGLHDVGLGATVCSAVEVGNRPSSSRRCRSLSFPTGLRSQLEIIPWTSRTARSLVGIETRASGPDGRRRLAIFSRSAAISALVSSRAMRALANWTTVAGDLGTS